MLRGERPVSHRYFSKLTKKITKVVRADVITQSNMIRRGGGLSERDVDHIMAETFMRISKKVYHDTFDQYDVGKLRSPTVCDHFITGCQFPERTIRIYHTRQADLSDIDFRPEGPYNKYKETRISRAEYIDVHVIRERDRWTAIPPRHACTNKWIRRRVTDVCGTVSQYIRHARDMHERSHRVYHIDAIRMVSKVLHKYADAMRYDRCPDTQNILVRISTDVIGVVHGYISILDLRRLALVDKAQHTSVKHTFDSCLPRMTVGRVVGVARVGAAFYKGIVLPCGHNAGACIDTVDAQTYHRHVGYHVLMETGVTKWIASQYVHRVIAFSEAHTPTAIASIGFRRAPWGEQPHMERDALDANSDFTPPSACYIVQQETVFPDVRIGDVIDVHQTLPRNIEAHLRALHLQSFTHEPWY